MKLRPGTAADADAIAGLVASFQREITVHPQGEGAEHYLASVSPAAERGYLTSGRYRFIVAETEGALIGFIALRDGRHVFHLFVARAHQRRGVARRLWDEARAQALRTGSPSPFTVNSSLGAVAVYRAFGFEPTGEVASIHGISYLPMQLDPHAGGPAMPAYGPLCTEFYDHDKPGPPADALEYYRARMGGLPGPVLEPMCGSGRFLLPLLGAGIEIEGADVAPAMLRACRQHAARRQLHPVLYEQSIEALDLPRAYALAFVPSGSIQLLDPDALTRALRSLHRHLMPGAVLLLELADVGGDAAEGCSPAPRVVPVEDDATIVYQCRVEPSGAREGLGCIRYEGRYEKWKAATLLAVEQESIVLWRLEPAALLQRLQDCGYVGARVVDGTPYASLRTGGCVLVEARVEA